MKTLNACWGGRAAKPALSRLGRAFQKGMCCAAALLFLTIISARAEGENRTVLAGHVLPIVAKSTPVAQMDGNSHLRLAIGLPLRNREALTNLMRDIYNPASANYHHYLTPEQFTAQFCPTDADYQALIAFARTNGLTNGFTLYPNRMLLDVEGSVADIERAFNVQMNVFQHPTESRTYYAAVNEPSVPAGLSVIDISGLNNYQRPYPKYKNLTAISNLVAKAQPKLGSGPGGTYMGKDFRQAYVPGVVLNGAGQTVGLLQFDGYFTQDIKAYETQNGLPDVPLVNILLDGYNGTPTLTGGEVEVSLDIEMVVSMAPGVDKILVYEAGPFGSHNDILNRMASDNLAKQIGCSWGWGGGPQSTTEQIFLQMGLQGQTFYDASGDSDAFLPGQVDDPTFPGAPSSSPNIVQVGATTLSTTGPGGNYLSETVWQTGADVGSSGGISSFYGIPPWQAGIDMAANQGSTTFRNIPDVAMAGDNIYVISDQGSPFAVGGTSCAAPLWAGFTALVNQQAVASGEGTIGFADPAIYTIGTGATYGQCFHDVITGNNTNSGSPTLFPATVGYDLCTGWGSPTGSNLINTLAPPIAVPILVVSTNTITGGNGNAAIDPRECNSMFIVISNIGPAGASTVQADLSTSTPGVIIPQSHAVFPDVATGGAATNVNPFEISTTPTFVCGSPIFFTLTIKTDQTTVTRVFSLLTGSPGTPVRYDSTNVVTIVAGPNGTSSTINITNLDSAISHVTVSAYVFESFDFALTLQLIAPDGTTATLSQNNGFNGQNYGIDCVDGDRTTFDDGAATFIINGQAPFIGSFQPQSSLSVFNGKSGTNVNGGWQLHAIDPFFGDFGAIECWSLIITPSTCVDGGGQCPGVDLALSMTGLPEPVLVGSNLTYTMTVTNLGPDTATGVALVQNLPANVNFVSATLSQGSYVQSSNLISLNLGTLIVGQVSTNVIIVQPTAPGTIFSSATVGAQQLELNPANNSATVANHVKAPAADLNVTMVGNPNPVLLNGLLTYTTSVLNNGPSVASNVIVTNILPLNVSFVSASASQGGVANSANIVIANLGDVPAGTNAFVTVQVRPQVLGQITATASAASSVNDPIPANNVATANVNVTAAADLVLSMTGPSSVVAGSNAVYQINVLNMGPSPATGVNLRDTLPVGGTLLSSNTPAGSSVFLSGGVLSCLISNLPVNSSASLTVTIGTAGLGSGPVTISNVASVTANQADPNTTNNSAAISTLVTFPAVNVVGAGYQLIGESFVPTNGMIEPGEQVTLLFRLQNLGNIDTGANLTATLLNSGGVSPANGSQILNYGTLLANGPAASQPFKFAASGSNGATITASVQIKNNGTNLTTVNFPFTLALSNSFANTNDIIIPSKGPGVPYPAGLAVSGMSGILGKVTVTFTNLNHTFPDDVDMVLVGPHGQNVQLMSHTGGNGVLTNTFVKFDPELTNSLLPLSSQITTGVYRPTQNGVINMTNTFNGTVVIPTNNPPPPPPYGTNLDIFNGTDPNGTWYLYVFDSAEGDAGLVKGGYQLGFTFGSPVNPVVDLSIGGKAQPSPVVAGNTLTYTFSVTNRGPSLANVIQFTNVLPANATFISATNSAHTTMGTNSSGALYTTFTNLASGSSVTITVVVVPNIPGSLSTVASITGSDSDPNISNNSTTVNTTVTAPAADLAVSMSGPTSAVTGSNYLYTVTVVNNGPGTALGVVVTDQLGLLSFVSGSAAGSASSPSFTIVSNSVVCNVGSLPSGASETVSLFLNSPLALTATNSAVATTLSGDTIAANNSASIVTVFSAPAPVIVAGSVHLVSGPANGSLISGQSATIAFALANIGSADTANLVATLMATNGVTSPSGAQSYGVLSHGGPAVAENFSFTPVGGNGAPIIAVFQLNDGASNLGTVSFTFNLPATFTFASTNGIIIPDHGPASPYPATITISNLAGVVTKATVTLSNYNHAFPDDVDVLLAGPTGQNLVLEAHDGGGHPITNVVLTFDDAAGATLPASGDVGTSTIGSAVIVSGTYKPGGSGPSLLFPSPAPSSTTGTTLATFNGTVANGEWTLYVFDSNQGDDGNIANGWSLNISTVSPVNSASDLGITVLPPSGALYPGLQTALNIGVANKGPADAFNVAVTNTLPAGLNFVSTSLGSVTTGAGGVYVFNVGYVPSGTTTNFLVTVSPATTGVYPITLSVGADQTDINPQDNTTQLSLQALTAPSLNISALSDNGAFTLTISVTGQPGTYDIVASSDLTKPLSTWTTVGTITNSLHSVQFTDTNASNFPNRYYRAVYHP